MISKQTLKQTNKLHSIPTHAWVGFQSSVISDNSVRLKCFII